MIRQECPVTIPLRVRGGVGSIAVQVTELLAAATRVGALGRLLIEGAARAAVIAEQVDEDGCDWLDPGGHRGAAEAVEAAIAGPGGARRLGALLIETASKLRSAADSYERADSSFSGRMGLLGDYASASLIPFLAIPAAVSGLIFEAGLTVPGLASAGAAADELLARLLVRHPAAIEALTGMVPDVMGALTLSPGLDTGHELAELLGVWAGLAGRVLAGGPWFADGRFAAVRVDQATGRPSSPPRGVPGLISRIPEASQYDPEVVIDRVDAPGGRHWVVLIPGTAGLPPKGGPSPFDGAGALGLAAQRRTAGIDAVVRSMRALHIPRGEPVLIAGHSQGGMIAAAMAADPVVAAEFSITHLVTAGSPIGETPIPDSVQVLSIEHLEDAIPRLDSAANPDRANWTTIAAPALCAGDHVWSAHALSRYAVTAGWVGASKDPSVQAWASSARGFFDSPGSTATSWTIHVRRARAAGARTPEAPP